SFFSTTLLEQGEELDLLNLYIPANPFNSLANNIVPAVVLFSALLGIALIGVPGKAPVLEMIEVITRAVARVAQYIVALTPFGLFAIAAVVAGTFDPGEAAQVETYLISYVVISLLLALWVLPGLVAAVTPVPHRAILATTANTLLVAFSTGSLLLVLPLLTDHARQLLREHTLIEAHDERLPDVLVPASFNFPHTAKVLSLSFVLFAAWFAGTSFSPAHYATLATTGLLAVFANVTVAVPFLLDLLKIPADTFQLFLATSVVNSRFGTMLSAVHTLVVALVGACALIGAVRFDAGRLLRFVLMTLVISAAAIGGTRLFVARVVSQPYNKDQVLAGMYAVRDRGTARVLPRQAPRLPPLTGTVLERVRSRRVLRVGYFEDSLPFVFSNARGDLVGFDVEMALQLSRDLNVALEMVPVERRLLDEGLDPAVCDLVMSGVAVTADRTIRMLFTRSYLDETLALLVLDYRRVEFSSWEKVRSLRSLRLGVPRAPYYLQKVRTELPSAEIVPVDEVEDALQPRDPPLDALILTAERGSAYTLLHPEYSVVVPTPRLMKVPLAYAVAGWDQSFTRVVDEWIDLKRKDGTIDELFAHWILGRDATRRPRRWSVLDDVLSKKD
ncbi:MAG: cation:dicarboxylate symporter family transporter, partial [Acidobacteriota bacterium]